MQILNKLHTPCLYLTNSQRIITYKALVLGLSSTSPLAPSSAISVTLSTGDFPSIQVDITGTEFESSLATIEDDEIVGTTESHKETELTTLFTGNNQEQVDHFEVYDKMMQDDTIAYILKEAEAESNASPPPSALKPPTSFNILAPYKISTKG